MKIALDGRLRHEVQFQVEQSEKGPQAANVKAMGKYVCMSVARAPVQ